MCSPHREPAPGLGGESERIGIVPNVALDYGCLRNASGEYAATHGRRREASTARIEEVRVKQPSIGGLLHVIEGAGEGMGSFEVRDEGVILVRGRRGVCSGSGRGPGRT